MFKLARTIAAGVAATLMVSAYAETGVAQTKYRFDVSPQPLGKALNVFAAQTGLNIYFDPSAIAGMESPALNAELTPEDALGHLLNGSRLKAVYVDEHTIRVMPENMAPKKTAHDSVATSTQLAQTQALMRLAQAESPETDGKESRHEAGGENELHQLEEVIVTAQRREEGIQDVPLSVSAVSGDEIDRMGASTIKEVLSRVPGLAFADNTPGNAKYAIRGISNGNAASGTSSTTGLYLDDISLLSGSGYASGAYDPLLFDMERVEVLKGPQGTLYGGSALGGAIKYITARPDLSEESGTAAGGVNTTAHGGMGYTAEAVINLPVVKDVFALRFGAKMVHDGGFIDNIAGLDTRDPAKSSQPYPNYVPLVQPALSTMSKSDYNFTDIYSLRASALYQPDPTLSIRGMVLYEKLVEANPSFVWTNLPALTTSYRYVSQPTKDRTNIATLDVKKDLGGVELTSITGYNDRKRSVEWDYSFYIGYVIPGFYQYNSFLTNPFTFQTFSQEIRLASTDNTSPLRWLIGGYLSRQKSSNNGNNVDIFGFGNLLKVVDSKGKRDESALFGEATYEIFDGLELTAGARVYQIKTFSDGRVEGLLADDPAPTQDKASGISPKIAVSYEPHPDHLLYASAAKGFRSGADTGAGGLSPLCGPYLAQAGFPNGKPRFYDPDNLWTYEVGTKNQFAGRRVTLNGAAFYTDWKDIQQEVRLPDCGAAFVTNAGDARIYGLEAEGLFNPVEGLEFGGNLTYLDAKIHKPLAALDIQPGDEILNTPKWSAGVFGSYSFPVSEKWKMRVQADYRYNGRQRLLFTDTQNVTFAPNFSGTPAFPVAVPIYQDAYQITNAGVLLSGPTVDFRFYVNNVFDASPLINERVDVGASRGVAIRPRTVGVEVRQKF